MTIVIVAESSGDGLEETLEAAGDLGRPLRQSVQAWRSVGTEEFAEGAWRARSGPPRAWEPTQDGIDPPLKGGGGLLASWLGGPGGIERFDNTSAEFGSSLAHAEVHRGPGAVTAADSRIPFKFRMTRRQRAFLAIKAKEEGRIFGRRLEGDPNRGVIVIPRRPHFTSNPEVLTRINAIFSAHMGGREVPSELLD
jgi:hypothetical protein